MIEKDTEEQPYEICRHCHRKIIASDKYCAYCEDQDYDPTPCCYQHGVGAIGTNEKCPDIADND